MAIPGELLDRVRRLALQNALEHGGAPRPGPILSRLLASDASLRGVARPLDAAIRSAIDEVVAMAPEARRAELDRLGGPEAERERAPKSDMGEFPPLPGARPGEVVLRMAPFPSGALHIGNARMIFVNQYYRERYGGKLLLVFDDTAGSEEKRVDTELYGIIEGDLERAGARPDAVYYKSDRIPNFYPWARKLIELSAAYVCVCPAEQLRENRKSGVECPERVQSVEEGLDGWEKMLGGTYGEGEAVLRLKTDLGDPDPAFRDRVLCRISEIDHPRVGTKYRVWPLLEFSWAIDDVDLGVTHVVRGKDLVMEDRMERFLWDVLKLHGPPFLHWGLLRVREAKISKSKSYAEVKSGQYDGWADPRTWSLRSLDRRGISPEAVKRFTLSFGLSLADIEVPAETLYAFNRSIIDSSASRRAYVDDPVAVDVEGYPDGLAEIELANHPDLPALGRRAVPGGPGFWMARRDLLPHAGEEVRLKDLVNVELPAQVPVSGGGSIVARFTSKENKRLPRLQWVGRSGAVEVDLLDPEGAHRLGTGERALSESAPGAVLQFERVGFVRVETDWTPGSGPVRVVYGHP